MAAHMEKLTEQSLELSLEDEEEVDVLKSSSNPL